MLSHRRRDSRKSSAAGTAKYAYLEQLNTETPEFDQLAEEPNIGTSSPKEGDGKTSIASGSAMV